MIWETEIVKHANKKMMQKAADLIKAGEIVAFPTETVYGLGADASNAIAVEKIFKAKGRPQDNPLIVHIADQEMLFDCISGPLTKMAQKLIAKFWPGPLTLIFDKSNYIPEETSAGLKTVAIRMPKHPVALDLIKRAGLPLAAPSANSSGYPSPTRAEHVYYDLEGKIPLIVDGGSSQVGIESTVLDIRGEKPIILRPGGITSDDLREVLGEDLVHYEKSTDIEKPVSPGMKYRHYAPHKAVSLLSTEEIQALINNCPADPEKKFRKAIIISKETDFLVRPDCQFKIIRYGSRNNPAKLARKLFSLLRSLDQDRSVKQIYIEKIPEKGLGEAVMNRLQKAALQERPISGGGD